jgi:hypothetical protein
LDEAHAALVEALVGYDDDEAVLRRARERAAADADAEARLKGNETAIAAARVLAREAAAAAARSQAKATPPPRAMTRLMARPIPATRLESLVADAVGSAPSCASSGDTTVASVEGAAIGASAISPTVGLASSAVSTYPSAELGRMRPGQTVWVPSRGAVGTVVSNNPFFEIMHVSVGGATIEVAYEELRVRAELVASENHAHKLSTAIASLESEVRGLTDELRNAGDPHEHAVRLLQESISPTRQLLPRRAAREPDSGKGLARRAKIPEVSVGSSKSRSSRRSSQTIVTSASRSNGASSTLGVQARSSARRRAVSPRSSHRSPASPASPAPPASHAAARESPLRAAARPRGTRSPQAGAAGGHKLAPLKAPRSAGRGREAGGASPQTRPPLSRPPIRAQGVI